MVTFLNRGYFYSGMVHLLKGGYSDTAKTYVYSGPAAETENKLPASLELTVSREIVPRGKVDKFLERVVNGQRYTGDYLKLDLALHSPRANHETVYHSIKLSTDIERGGKVANTPRDRNNLYWVSKKMAKRFKEQVLRKDARKANIPGEDAVAEFIAECLEEETEIPVSFN